MKADFQQIKTVLSNHRDFLKSEYRVKNIGIFGSVVEGKNTENSDIDILVDFSKALGFFKFIELENFLSKITKKKVDLVTEKALKSTIKEEILEEVKYV